MWIKRFSISAEKVKINTEPLNGFLMHFKDISEKIRSGRLASKSLLYALFLALFSVSVGGFGLWYGLKRKFEAVKKYFKAENHINHFFTDVPSASKNYKIWLKQKNPSAC